MQHIRVKMENIQKDSNEKNDIINQQKEQIDKLKNEIMELEQNKVHSINSFSWREDCMKINGILENR